MLSLSSWRTSRPRYRARCDSIKNLLRLGVVQSSRSSPRRADASEKRPARRIAGGEALFQTFIDLVFGRRSSQRLRRALAPRLRGPMPMLWNGPGHHVTGGLVATNTAEAHGRRPVLMLMIHLLLAAAHCWRTPSGCIDCLDRPAYLPFEVNALSGHLTSPLGTRARDMAARGLQWRPSAPSFFRRTSREVGKMITALDDPRRATILKKHIARIDDPRLRRAFQAAVDSEVNHRSWDRGVAAPKSKGPQLALGPPDGKGGAGSPP